MTVRAGAPTQYPQLVQAGGDHAPRFPAPVISVPRVAAPHCPFGMIEVLSGVVRAKCRRFVTP